MDKVFVAQRVANKLFATEDKLDAALAEAAQLMNEMIAARDELNFSRSLGDEAVTKLLDAMKAMGEARTNMVSMHADLYEAKLRLGIRTKMNGELTVTQRAEQEPTVAVREVG
jgi:spore cortex formation protein SpoVR/YcgB (stage V sporulation)